MATADQLIADLEQSPSPLPDAPHAPTAQSLIAEIEGLDVMRRNLAGLGQAQHALSAAAPGFRVAQEAQAEQNAWPNIDTAAVPGQTLEAATNAAIQAQQNKGEAAAARRAGEVRAAVGLPSDSFLHGLDALGGSMSGIYRDVRQNRGDSANVRAGFLRMPQPDKAKDTVVDQGVTGFLETVPVIGAVAAGQALGIPAPVSLGAIQAAKAEMEGGSPTKILWEGAKGAVIPKLFEPGYVLAGSLGAKLMASGVVQGENALATAGQKALEAVFGTISGTAGMTGIQAGEAAVTGGPMPTARDVAATGITNLAFPLLGWREMLDPTRMSRAQRAAWSDPRYVSEKMKPYVFIFGKNPDGSVASFRASWDALGWDTSVNAMGDFAVKNGVRDAKAFYWDSARNEWKTANLTVDAAGRETTGTGVGSPAPKGTLLTSDGQFVPVYDGATGEVTGYVKPARPSQQQLSGKPAMEPGTTPTPEGVDTRQTVTTPQAPAALPVDSGQLGSGQGGRGEAAAILSQGRRDRAQKGQGWRVGGNLYGNVGAAQEAWNQLPEDERAKTRRPRIAANQTEPAVGGENIYQEPPKPILASQRVTQADLARQEHVLTPDRYPLMTLVEGLPNGLRPALGEKTDYRDQLQRIRDMGGPIAAKLKLESPDAEPLDNVLLRAGEDKYGTMGNMLDALEAEVARYQGEIGKAKAEDDVIRMQAEAAARGEVVRPTPLPTVPTVSTTPPVERNPDEMAAKIEEEQRLQEEWKRKRREAANPAQPELPTVNPPAASDTARFPLTEYARQKEEERAAAREQERLQQAAAAGESGQLSVVSGQSADVRALTAEQLEQRFRELRERANYRDTEKKALIEVVRKAKKKFQSTKAEATVAEINNESNRIWREGGGDALTAERTRRWQEREAIDRPKRDAEAEAKWKAGEPARREEQAKTKAAQEAYDRLVRALPGTVVESGTGERHRVIINTPSQQRANEEAERTNGTQLAYQRGKQKWYVVYTPDAPRPTTASTVPPSPAASGATPAALETPGGAITPGVSAGTTKQQLAAAAVRAAATALVESKGKKRTLALMLRDIALIRRKAKAAGLTEAELATTAEGKPAELRRQLRNIGGMVLVKLDAMAKGQYTPAGTAGSVVRETPFSLESETPEQVKARQAAEKAKALKRAQTDEVARKAAAPLTGSSANVGQGVLDAGSEDLFSGPSAEREKEAVSEKVRQLVAPAREGTATGQVYDFGEKIGGARKDTARKTGPKDKTPAVEPDEEVPAWRRHYKAVQETKGYSGYTKEPEYTGRWVLTRDGKHVRGGETFDSADAAMEHLELVEMARNHRVYQERKGEAWGIYRMVGDHKRPLVKGGFESEDAAKRYMVGHAVELIEHRFQFPTVPWLDRIERTGPDVRKGNVTPQMFQDTFGFRGGEFGNWNMGTEGQQALNHGYDALMDLARVLNLPPKALSLHGQLAIAFGARGTGGFESASAHYEPDARVINLTKIKGAGSLAHEWFHGLDHYLFAFPGYGPKGRSGHVTLGIPREGMRAEMIAKVKSLMEAILTSSSTVENPVAVATQRAEYVTKGLRQDLDQLRQQFNEYPGYKKRPKPTEAQLAKWDALVQKVLAGDVGEYKWVDAKASGRKFSLGGRHTFERVEEMNSLYKSVVGNSFATSDRSSRGASLVAHIESAIEARKRVEAAQAGEVMTRRGPSQYLKDSREIDSFRASDYWSAPHEMGARALAAYVEDALKDAKQKSQYLVHAADNAWYRALGLKPYPEGAERTKINAAFADIFKTIQTRETEGGKVEMYSLAPRSTPNAPRPRGLPIPTVRAIVAAVFGGKVPGWLQISDGKGTVDSGQSRTLPTGNRQLSTGQVEGVTLGAKVTIYANQMRDAEHVRETLAHELFHRAKNTDPEVAEAIRAFEQTLTPEQIKAEGWHYEPGKQREEAAAQKIGKRFASDEQRSAWRKLWDAIKAWFRRTFRREIKADYEKRVMDAVMESARRDAEGVHGSGFTVQRGMVRLGNAMVSAKAGLQRIGAMFKLRAHHGTPHTVDKFSTAKIGTGEGAQVYGWGLYFAENEAVAHDYRIQLTGGNRNLYDGKPFDPTDPKHVAAYELSRGLSREEAIAHLQQRKSKKPAERAADRAAIAVLEEHGEAKIAVERTGNLYTVEVDAEPGDLLDWDKPLSEQSEKVKAALQFMAVMGEAGFRPKSAQELSGSTIYDLIANAHGGTPRQASAALSKAGIVGIRYLDQGSRTKYHLAEHKDSTWTVESGGTVESNAVYTSVKSSQVHAGPFKSRNEAQAALDKLLTYNYVIFDENRIKITGRNGEPVTMAEAQGSGDAEPKYSLAKPEERSNLYGVISPSGTEFHVIDVDTGDVLAKHKNARAAEADAAGRNAVDAMREAGVDPAGVTPASGDGLGRDWAAAGEALSKAIIEDVKAVGTVPPPLSFKSIVGSFRKSAVDTLHDAGGLADKLATAYEDAMDDFEALVGSLNTPIETLVKKLPRAERKRVLAEFEGYMLGRETEKAVSGEPSTVSQRELERAGVAGQTAEDLYAGLSEPARKLVDAVQKMLEFTGEQNKSFGVKVKDGERWRDIGQIKEYWPRMLRREIRKVLSNPNTNPKEHTRLMAELAEHVGGDPKRLAVSKDLLAASARPDTADNFFANIERGRVGGLPQHWYSHRFEEVVPRYIAAWSRRIAQIKHFGQAWGPHGDLFDETIDAAHGDEVTRRYLQLFRDAVYERKAVASGAQRLLRLARAYTVLTKLTSPISSARNLSTVFTNTLPEFGLRATFPALFKPSYMAARESGALRSDLIAGWVETRDWTDRQAKVISGALNVSGFSVVERYNRASAVAAGLNWARWALEKIEANPDSRSSLLAKAKFAKFGVDWKALRSEGLGGLEGGKLMRAASRHTQFMYDLRQNPLWMETQAAKFLFQFQKFGVQQLRRFEQEVVMPMVRGYEVDGKRVHDAKPLFVTLAAAIGTGAALLYLFRELLFKRKRPDATVQEIVNTWDEDRWRAFRLGLAHLWHDATYTSAFGVLGDWSDNFNNFYQRLRGKNPLEPPGLSILYTIWDQIVRTAQQKTVTFDDLDKILTRELAAYSQLRDLGNNAAGKFAETIGEEWKGAVLQDARTTASEILRLGERFADEMGMEKRLSIENKDRTPRSPLYDKLYRALLVGGAVEARKVSDEILAGAKNFDERKRLEAGMRSMARGRMPGHLGGLDAADAREYKDMFHDWVARRAPDVLPRLDGLIQRYQQTAADVGLMDSPGMEKLKDSTEDTSKTFGMQGLVDRMYQFNMAKATGTTTNDVQLMVEKFNQAKKKGVQDTMERDILAGKYDRQAQEFASGDHSIQFEKGQLEAAVGRREITAEEGKRRYLELVRRHAIDSMEAGKKHPSLRELMDSGIVKRR